MAVGADQEDLRVEAVEIVVEMDDGQRAVERIERVTIDRFDRETLPNGTRVVSFKVTGREVPIGSRFGAHARK